MLNILKELKFKNKDKQIFKRYIFDLWDIDIFCKDINDINSLIYIRTFKKEIIKDDLYEWKLKEFRIYKLTRLDKIKKYLEKLINKIERFIY